MEKDLDEKFGEDSVLSKIVPWLSRWIDTKTHIKQYERAVRTFLDLRKKNPKHARQNLVKAAQINNVDIRSLDKFFRAMVDKGVMPAHLINYHPTFMTKAFGENMELEEKKSKKFKDIRKDDPCWDGYKQVGMKKKNGKEVPNCVPEETEITEMKLPISDEMFKSLKKGDKIKINFDSSIKKGNENTYVVQSKSKSAKYNLEKIKLKNASNPVAQASYLYNRQGKVTMSQGDMAVTMNSVVKEAVSAFGDYKANLTPDSSKPLGGKIERPHLVKSYKNRKHASRWVRVVYDFDAAVKKYPRKAVRELGKKDQWGEKIVQIWENENIELEAANLLNEGMSPSQIAQLKKAYGSIDKVDVTGPAYKKAKAFIANMSKDELMTMAKAKVKWLSQFAASELAKTHNVRLKAKDYMESVAFGDFRKKLNTIESVDEAALKTSDYPKGTSMSAQKFKNSQKKMSKQRALTTKDYPKGTSMSATAWKNRQEEVELDEASREDKIKKTISIMKKYPANKGKSEKELRKGAIAYLDQFKKEEVDTGQYAARKKPTSSKQAQQSVFDKHRAAMRKLRDAPKGSPWMKKAGKDAKMLRFVLNRDAKLRKESIELDEAIDFRKAFMDIQSYAKKNGGMDKTDFEKVAYYVKAIGDNQNTPNVANKAFMLMKKHIAGLDTDVRDGIHMLLKKHGMIKNGRIVQESIELDEKAVSKSQQKFFGMVRATQKGEMDDASPEVKKAADSMSKKDVKDFAKTKHKDLPDKVKEDVELDEAKCGCCGNEITTEGCGCGSDCEHCGGMGKVLGESKYAVDIEGLPKFYMDSDSPGKVKMALRKLLKNPASLNDVHRVPEGEVKSDFRKRAAGKEEVEEATLTENDRLEKQAIAIAKKMSGNMTGAVKEIEKIKKGLSKNSSVQKALRVANEEVDLELDQIEESVAKKLSKVMELMGSTETSAEAIKVVAKEMTNGNTGQAKKLITQALKANLGEAKKLDPVGDADADIDNDGDVDKSDKYLHKRRKAIKKSIDKVTKKKSSEASEESKQSSKNLSGKQEKITISPKAEME